MHIPKYFEVTDPTIMEQFIKENSFATIVSSGSPYPVATHIPVELETNAAGEKVLWGHVSRANAQWEVFAANPEVLVIFFSPIHSYISSSWYEQPNVPTWNYMSVHVYGKARIIEGEALRESLRRLVHKYEQHSENPVSLDTLPESVQKQINGLVGFEIRPERMEAAFKLSQNRKPEDYENIIRELRATGQVNARLMADVMENRIKK